MHLMSFYATPYASRHREEKAAKKRFFLKLVWFICGILCGAVLFYALSQWGSDDNENVITPETPIGDILGTKPNNIDEVIKPDESADGNTEAKLYSELTGEPVIEEEVPAKITEDIWPKEVEIEVTSGDTFNSLLVRQGISASSAHRLAKQIKPVYNISKLQLGDKMTLTLSKDDVRIAQNQENDVEADVTPTTLDKLIIYVDNITHVEITPKGEDTYEVRKVKKKLVRDEARAKTKIEGSLYLSAQKEGMPSLAINKLVKNYSYDIDFQRDIKAGDLLDVIYEVEKTEDGEVVNTQGAEIVYSMLKNKGRVIKHYRFKDENGYYNYYNEKGQNIVKKLLKTPVDGARMSSNYGMRRHPILGYSRMHTGVDFAVPRGTPIYAAGDGVITYAGYKGSYGKYVSIKHNKTYSTAYAHAHRIAKGIKTGMRVRQGQVIAYVGSTGRSTGPHLHYEILRYGKHVNPTNVKFTGGNELTGKRLAAFKQHVSQIQQKLATMESGASKNSSLASADHNNSVN